MKLTEIPEVAGLSTHEKILDYAQGRFTEAEPLYKRSLAIDEAESCSSRWRRSVEHRAHTLCPSLKLGMWPAWHRCLAWRTVRPRNSAIAGTP